MEDTNRSPFRWPRWPMVGLLLAAVVGLTALLAVTARAQTDDLWAGTTGTDGVTVVAGQLSRDLYGLYLIDHETDTICVYQYAPGERKLNLVAVRRYTFDVQLDEAEWKKQPDK